MPRVFHAPADLVGQLNCGNLLADSNGQLLLVGEPCHPKDFPEPRRSVIDGHHYLMVFGDEMEYTIWSGELSGLVWPLRLVQAVPDDGEPAHCYR